MKKYYIKVLLFFVFGLLFSFQSYGQLVANPNQGSITHSGNVQIAIQNVLGNDTLNGIPVTLSDVTISQLTPTTHVNLQPNGSVVVAANTPSGSYGFDYQICQISNPTNCSISSVSVQVNSAPITVVNESVTISMNQSAPQIILENVLANDTLGGIPVSVSDVTIHQLSSTASDHFNIDPLTGNIILINNPPAPDTFILYYYYCENSNPNNCVEANVSITVVNSLLTTITGTYQDFNADGITNVGDVINYTYSITNIGSAAVSNVSITSSEVNINGGPPIPLLNPGANNNSTYTGIHAITQEDINNGRVLVTIQTNGTLSGNPISVSNTHTVNLVISNGIRLNAFLDYNGNGTQQNGEPSFTNGTFQYELNNNGTVHNIISPNGQHLLYETNPANSYDLGYTLDAAYAAQYTVATASYPNITVANGSGMVTYNFAVSQLPFTDLRVYLYSSLPPRPGFDHHDYISFTNSGNQTVASGTITYTKGNNVSIVSYPAGATPTANGFTYDFTNLAPNEWRTIDVTLNTALIPVVSLGDLVTSTVSTTVPANDINANNNASSLTQVIVGSYDPNDKTESHGPQIQHSTFSANDYLTYTIRFENTGTAEAINVRVNDVLDAKLDETTVRMVSASHAYVLDRVGSNLTWKFDGINLEPSIPGNPVIGHGYLVFQVKPKAGYVIGDVIPNTASIYFDFNPAIVTDPWTTSFVLALGNPTFGFDNFRYHPNPVKNSLTISNDTNIDTIEITSVIGQKVRSLKANSLQAEIDMTGLTSGLYFVKVTGSGKEKTIKIIKE